MGSAQYEFPRLMLDHMLVKLGKYLRIIGLDAEWDLTERTHELILRANRERRVFLTRNRHLPFAYPKPDRLFMPQATDPVAQFTEVVAALNLDTHGRRFTTCIRCNLPLDRVGDKTAIRSRVHPNVYARYERFFTCPGCHTVFWHGSHVRNTCRKLGLPSPPEWA